MIKLDHLQEIFSQLYVDCYGIGFHHKAEPIFQDRAWLTTEIEIMLEDMGRTMDLDKQAAKFEKRDAAILEHIIKERSKARPLRQSLGDLFPRHV